MDLNNLDLNLLVSLDALLTEKSVSRAAERKFLSQSAMSSSLRRLRETFQDQLLVTVGRTMILTPLAADLVKPVRDILLHIQAVTSIRPAFDPAVSRRTITLVVSDYACTVFIPEVLRRAKKEAPDIKVRLRPIEYKWGELLQRGTVDFALIVDAMPWDDCPSEPIFTDRLCCSAWSENRIEGERMSLEQYLQMGHVAMEFGGGRLHLQDAHILKKLGYTRNIEVTAPDFNVVPQLVVGTDRIASLPSRLAKLYAKHLPLTLFPIPIDIPPLVEMLHYHKYQELDQASTWFRNLLKEVGKEMPDP
jgi:LysR family nod box-dependent transcriptional activator